MPASYTIRIHAIPLTDADGGRANTVTAAAFAGAVAEVNKVFAPADIRFDFDPGRDWHPMRDTSLNSLTNVAPGSWWTEANTVAEGLRGRLTLFLRWGSDPSKSASNWFAYPPDTGQTQPALAKLPHGNIDFVAITNQQKRFGSGAGVVLAHEIGHYLGLFHTHPGWGPADPAQMEQLAKDKGAAGLDGDLLSDTQPDPGPTYYVERVDSDMCGGPATFTIGGVQVSPDRSNVMSYYQRCQPPATLTRKQIAVLRKTVQHPTRQHLIAESAGVRYAGVFRAGTDRHTLWVGDDWEGFSAKRKELSEKGLRLIDLETYVVSGKRRFTGVFRAGTDAHALWVANDWEGFSAKWSELSEKGLRLIDLETWQDGRTRKYAGVFRAGTDAHFLWVANDWNGFVAKWKELSEKGLRLIDLETWQDGKTRKYAGVFRAGTDAHFLWVDQDYVAFSAKWKELAKDGLRLIDLETWQDGKTRKYAGVFRAGTDAQSLWVDDDWFGFSKKWEQLSKDGQRLVDIEVFGSLVG